MTVSISPFTAPSGGVLTWNGPAYRGDGRPEKEIKVNESVNLDGTSAVASYMSGTVPGKVIPLKKGDIVTFNNILDIKFFSYEED
jgi:hypothetical protein